MEESNPTKGTRPIAGFIMYNFIYWLVMHHPEIKTLRLLPQEYLLQLIQQFETSRPDIGPNTPRAWSKGFEKLFSNNSEEDDYADIRKFLNI